MKYLIAIVALTATICLSQGYHYHYDNRNYGLPVSTPSNNQFAGYERCIILFCNEYSGVCTRYLQRYAKDKIMPDQGVKSGISSDSRYEAERRYDDYYNIEDRYGYGGGRYNSKIYPEHQSNGYNSQIYPPNAIGEGNNPQKIPKVVTTSVGGRRYKILVRD